MIVDTTTPATAADTSSSVMNGVQKVHGAIVAVGAVIIAINAACYMYDRIKAARKTDKQKQEDQEAVAKVWAKANAEANAELFQAAAEAAAVAKVDSMTSQFEERLRTIEASAKKKNSKTG